MFSSIIKKFIGSKNERELKKLWPIVATVRTAEKLDALRLLTREDLPKKTEELRARVQAGATLESLLPEAFVVVIRACELLVGETMEMGKQVFTWNMIPFDVQILGGAVLHRGGIAEMKTGRKG